MYHEHGDTPILCAALLGVSLTAARADSGFSDVAPDSWAAGYIGAIADAGITTGCGGSHYCPRGAVTREQMAAFLIRGKAGEPPADYCADNAPFTDLASDGWSCGYVKWLAELAITTGCGGNNYCPRGVVTRAQMAAFLIRAMEGEPPAD